MKREHIWIPIALLTCVFLIGCRKDDARHAERGRDEETGLLDRYGLFLDASADSPATTTQAFGTCSDDAQFFSDCEAPIAEPPLSTSSEAVDQEILCTVTRCSDDSPVPQVSDHTPAVVSTRCGNTGSLRNFVADADGRTMAGIPPCSCGMKRCGCG